MSEQPLQPRTNLEGTPGETQTLWRVTPWATLVLALLMILWLGSGDPLGKSGFQKTRRQAQTLVSQIKNHIQLFFAEYSKYPLPLTTIHSESIPLRTGEALTAMLRGTNPDMNPKQLNFLRDLNPAEASRRYGLKSTDAGMCVVDPWGEELYILLDADSSGDIANPDPAAKKKVLSHGVLVFSAGPDKDPTTWEDNITSWTRRDGRKYRLHRP